MSFEADQNEGKREKELGKKEKRKKCLRSSKEGRGRGESFRWDLFLFIYFFGGFLECNGRMDGWTDRWAEYHVCKHVDSVVH